MLFGRCSNAIMVKQWSYCNPSKAAEALKEFPQIAYQTEQNQFHMILNRVESASKIIFLVLVKNG